MTKTLSDRKVRYAVVGLGHISQIAVLPAFEHTEDSELCALISGDERKLAKLAKVYDIEVTGEYGDLERVLEQSQAEAVYIATPNTLHRPHTERAARAGVHVLCEKPMAPTEADCQAMIDGCRAAGVKLMIAYRLYFDEAHLESLAIVQSGRIGVPRVFSSLLTHQVKPGDIRTRGDLAGGALYDLGVYPIHSARQLFDSEPTGVLASSHANSRHLDGIDATTSATLAFDDDRLAQFTVSQNASPVSSYRLLGEKGDLLLEPAYAYDQPLRHVLSIGHNSVERRYGHKDQFAVQISAFSRAIRQGDEIGPSGEEGLCDVRVLRALVESHAAGRRVDLPKLSHPIRAAC